LGTGRKRKILFGAFGTEDEVHYRDLGIGRLALVAASGGLMGYSQTHEHLLPAPFWTGVTMFLIAGLYGVWKAVRS